MLELFRFFRLGLVNVVGVTVPGVLFLLFAGVGFVLPLSLFVLYFNQLLTAVPHYEGWLLVGAAYRENKATLTVLFFVLAYVIGYIIRLSSPDELDRKSAKESMRLVARENPCAAEQAAEKDRELGEKMKRERLAEKEESRRPWWRRGLLRAREKFLRACEVLRLAARRGQAGGGGMYCDDVTSDEIATSIDKQFPYRGERLNKFPYAHFREYLVNRGFPELAKQVPTRDGAPPPGPGGTAVVIGKWTKTAVNMMKLEVQLLSPVLAAVIESNEAHIRLLSGTWQAINACRRIVAVGVGIAVLGSVANVLDKAQRLPPGFAGPLPPFLPCLLAGVVLYMGMRWARRRIETMFHHQRVRELTHIVGCFYFACEKYAAAQAAGRDDEARAARETREPGVGVPAL
ncbi:MAG TPA: hypothetical protein VN282_01485 [Pyrinomonadaceae bacterium]|nr:hypothetical protein [Pyrinomonadaceae bacterium]